VSTATNPADALASAKRLATITGAQDPKLVAFALQSVGAKYIDQGDTTAAESAYRDAVSLLRDDSTATEDLFRAELRLGHAVQKEGRIDDAAALNTATIAAIERAGMTTSPTYEEALNDLLAILVNPPAKANPAPVFDKWIPLVDRTASDDAASANPETGSTLSASVRYFRPSDPLRAARALRILVASDKRTSRNVEDRGRLVDELNELSGLYLRGKDSREAIAAAKDAVDIVQALPGMNQPRLAISALSLGDAERLAGDLSSAEATYRGAFDAVVRLSVKE
jgi:tetratricopeptide (TPR) repeat protein